MVPDELGGGGGGGGDALAAAVVVAAAVGTAIGSAIKSLYDLDPDTGTEGLPSNVEINRIQDERHSRRFVTIYKAPPNGDLAEKWAAQGFDPADFPGRAGEVPDGRAYFALDRSIAEEWNVQYKAGIIEVTISREDYDRYFNNDAIRQPYPGGRWQLAIPAVMLRILNLVTITRQLLPY